MNKKYRKTNTTNYLQIQTTIDINWESGPNEASVLCHN